MVEITHYRWVCIIFWLGNNLVVIWRSRRFPVRSVQDDEERNQVVIICVSSTFYYLFTEKIGKVFTHITMYSGWSTYWRSCWRKWSWREVHADTRIRTQAHYEDTELHWNVTAIPQPYKCLKLFHSLCNIFVQMFTFDNLLQHENYYSDVILRVGLIIAKLSVRPQL